MLLNTFHIDFFQYFAYSLLYAWTIKLWNTKDMSLCPFFHYLIRKFSAFGQKVVIIIQLFYFIFNIAHDPNFANAWMDLCFLSYSLCTYSCGRYVVVVSIQGWAG